MTRKEFITWSALFVVSIFGIGGVIETLISHAATPDGSVEAEKGTLAGSAVIETDSTASGSKAVVFGQVPSATPQPTASGLSGSWNLAFDDEFNGSSLDATKWAYGNFGKPMNNVDNLPASNVSVSGGNMIMTLSDSNTGALITTCDSSQTPWSNNLMMPEDFVEARVYFPGNGSNGQAYNWPAFWVSGPDWALAGENDIAEVRSNLVQSCYLSGTNGSNNQPQPAPSGGPYINNFHVYGLHRMASSCDVYYDGVKVSSYGTSDNGEGEAIAFNIGTNGNGNTNIVTGTASQVMVDYCRMWRPA